MEHPGTVTMMTVTVPSPQIGGEMQNCQCPGKMHRVEKLVDVWVYYEQVPTLRLREVFIGRVVSHKSTVYADTTAWLKLQSPRIGTGCGVRFLSQCQMWNRCSCS
jgi:hypothetical protein